MRLHSASGRMLESIKGVPEQMSFLRLKILFLLKDNVGYYYDLNDLCKDLGIDGDVYVQVVKKVWTNLIAEKEVVFSADHKMISYRARDER